MTILHSTKNYSVVSERRTRGRAVKKGDINVYSEATGKRVNFDPFETAEKAVAYVERKEKADAERKAKAEAAKVEEKEAEQEAAEELATPRQVNYILALLAQHDFQNTTWYSAGPTTIEGVQAMTKSAASTYISALQGN